MAPSWAFSRSVSCRKETGASTVGVRHRPDCLQASRAIFCQRSCFFAPSLAFSCTTQRLMATGTIRSAPSSTAFWMISSILSALGRPWYRVMRSRASVEGSSATTLQATLSPSMAAISAA